MRSDASVELVLLAPGLLGSGVAGAGDPGAAQALVEGLDLDGLDRLLSRAEHTAVRATDASLEALAFGAYGHDAPSTGTDWPAAAFTALIDCDAPSASGSSSESGGSGFRLRADPVHLRADISDLVLFDAAQAELSRHEADALARTVNDVLGPDGPCIDAAHPHRWYVALERRQRIATTPLSLATGAPVSAAMPHGPDAPRWHRWMNEVQMALHECPVNADRERRGAVPINSVWPWGAGSLPPALAAPAPFVQAWSDDALVRGLARRADVEQGEMPAGASAWLDVVARPGAHLVVFDDLYPPARSADIDAWRSGIAHFSAAWAQPLLGALDRGAVTRVSIHDERGNRFNATRGDAFGGGVVQDSRRKSLANAAGTLGMRSSLPPVRARQVVPGDPGRRFRPGARRPESGARRSFPGIVRRPNVRALHHAARRTGPR